MLKCVVGVILLGYFLLNLNPEIKSGYFRITSYNVCYTKLLRVCLLCVYKWRKTRRIKLIIEAVKVVGHEPPRSPDGFQLAAEHPQGIHVQAQVQQTRNNFV